MVHRIPASLRRRLLWVASGLALLVALFLGLPRVRAGGDDAAGSGSGSDTGDAAAAPTPADPGAVAAAEVPDSVPFDHSIHAGKYQMSCLFCHVDADKSPSAGLPSIRKCMGCHKFVDKEKPAVQELARLWTANQVPRWTRVYRLPDYVYFSHRVHVSKQVACASCHGDVPSMSRITRASSLTMGWCLDCHSSQHGPTDCLACHK